jgi:hypothetical protein
MVWEKGFKENIKSKQRLTAVAVAQLASKKVLFLVAAVVFCIGIFTGQRLQLLDFFCHGAPGKATAK